MSRARTLRPGVRTVWRRRAVGEVVEDARRRGASVHPIGPVAGKAELLAALAESLRFPHWVGRNWDALADALRDLSWLPAGPVAIVWAEPGRLKDADPAAYHTALDILHAAGTAAHPLTVLLVSSAAPS